MPCRGVIRLRVESSFASCSFTPEAPARRFPIMVRGKEISPCGCRRGSPWPRWASGAPGDRWPRSRSCNPSRRLKGQACLRSRSRPARPGGRLHPGPRTIRAWVSGQCRVLRGESRSGKLGVRPERGNGRARRSFGPVRRRGPERRRGAGSRPAWAGAPGPRPPPPGIIGDLSPLISIRAVAGLPQPPPIPPPKQPSAPGLPSPKIPVAARPFGPGVQDRREPVAVPAGSRLLHVQLLQRRQRQARPLLRLADRQPEHLSLHLRLREDLQRRQGLDRHPAAARTRSTPTPARA